VAEKKTSKAVVAVAGVCVVAAAACVVLWVSNPPFVARWRASYYAGKIGEGGSNGSLAKKLIALGKEAALPAVLPMLRSDDAVTRRYALIIIDQLNATEAAEAILEAMKTEPVVRNRSQAAAVISHLFTFQPEHCDKVIPFLKDPDEEVREVARGAMMKVANQDIPGRTAEQWIEWWESRKHKLHKNGAEQGAAGRQSRTEAEAQAPVE